MGLKQATPLIDDTKPCIIYASCPANLWCAMKRQGLTTPRVCPKMLARFNKFVETIFEAEIIPLLTNFIYSPEVWYNHLNRTQQNEIDGVKVDELDDAQKVYNLFCKRESQIVDDGEPMIDTYDECTCKNMPKNRCISCPNAEYKYVHGPVVYALEALFKKNFKGYTSGLSFADKEVLYNARRSRGLVFRVDGDGSQFDATQDTLLKVERKIYAWLADNDKISHVSEFVWNIFTSDNLKMKVTTMDKNDIYMRKLFGILKVIGRVMSGNMDTSFGNTLRMSLYNRFVWEDILHVDRDSYDLDCQGDDFDVFHDGMISRDRITEAYYQVWTKGTTQNGVYLNPEHGLGQILKYLKFGTIGDTSFCSTECFYCPECSSYRIIRQLERFITLNQWSKTLLSLSNHDQSYFLTSLYEANKLWIGKLDIFKQANCWLDYNVHSPSKILKGHNKKTLAYDPRFEFLVTKEPPIMAKLQQLDKSTYYSMKDRISEKKSCCNEAFKKQVLFDRYGLTADQVSSICDTIQSTPKYKNTCALPDLIQGFRTRQLYDAEPLYNGCDY
jgi:hypothetical protein